MTPDVARVSFLPAQSTVDPGFKGLKINTYSKGEDIIKRNKQNIKLMNYHNREQRELNMPEPKQIVVGSRFLKDARTSVGTNYINEISSLG